MKISICTISFRHELVSLTELARWAAENRFDGIELWGVHALNLGESLVPSIESVWSQGVRFSMLSDYFALQGEEAKVLRRAERMFQIARQTGVRKVRTFAGGRASQMVGGHERADAARRLNHLCETAAGYGLKLVVEIHPNSLADTLESTIDLIAEVDHPAMRINFDVLHVWESGADPLGAFRQLQPHVAHFHLKNVRSRRDLNVFEPANVYAAAGTREGMTPLFEGACDYESFFKEAGLGDEAEASLEWFGDDARGILKHDRLRLAAASNPGVLIPA